MEAEELSKAGCRHVEARDRYNTFIPRHEAAWELGMGALAILFVALGFLIDQVGSGTRPELQNLEVALTGLFLAEFASRVLAARDWRQYLRGHWVDLIVRVTGPPVSPDPLPFDPQGRLLPGLPELFSAASMMGTIGSQFAEALAADQRSCDRRQLSCTEPM